MQIPRTALNQNVIKLFEDALWLLLATSLGKEQGHDGPMLELGFRGNQVANSTGFGVLGCQKA